jgi:hypothetical protein
MMIRCTRKVADAIKLGRRKKRKERKKMRRRREISRNLKKSSGQLNPNAPFPTTAVFSAVSEKTAAAR